MLVKPNPKQSFPALELEILEYWKKNRIFEKSLEKNKGQKEYVFYDGPPFATGLPHYGHILAGTLKDVIPRYQTMKGYYVPRRWGWDCHGLPIENLVEQELELNSKKAILEFGVDKFNEACRASVLRYVKEWGKIVERMGRWVDFENSYKTMDSSFMESIWWVFKSLWDKKLIYRGKKTMHICPRCETPLSNFEVGQGYKDVSDPSVIWKFELMDESKTYLLAWTTTPWSTLSTMGLSINPDVLYLKVKIGDESVIFAKQRLEFVMKDIPDYEVVQEMKGSDLVGKKYHHIAPWYKDLPELKKNKGVYQVYAGDYVEVSEGTGIVTINGAYGEIDFEAARKNKLPILMDVGMDGRFTEVAGPFAGMNVKEAEKKELEYFMPLGLIFRTEKYTHSYPHCWRCETPLLNYCTDSWFVRVEKIKKKLLKANRKIHWVPEHIKHGRFGKWLENARDWAISRHRYWGTPLPVWEAVARPAVRSGPAVGGVAKHSETEIRKADYQSRRAQSPFGGNKGTLECLGSIADLRARVPGRFTKITLLRHGESEGNLIGLRQAQNPGTGLTRKGLEQSKAAAEKLFKIHQQEPFDLILSSPLLRTKQTAEIVGSALGLLAREDLLLREINFGEYEGKQDSELKEDILRRRALSGEDHFHDHVSKSGESHADIARRGQEFLKKALLEHAGKSLLIVTHSDFIRFFIRELEGKPYDTVYQQGHFSLATAKEIYIDNITGQPVDLHKHIIDQISYLHPKTGELMKRVPEVLDCWFESGSMPYSQVHYPFENKELFQKTFPANFIAEGLDQTRGWFYTLIVLAAGLFDQPAFRNIIVNGIVLAEDGQKMSKRKKNYPDPNHIFDTFGADAMRLYLMNSPVVKAEDFRFSEKGVQEIVRSILLPFWNAYSFFMTYAEIDHWRPKNQIYFVRHGETRVNKEGGVQGILDQPLNDTGRDQINDLRKITKHLPIDVIVSSDFLRTKESAQILNADFNLPVELVTDLREQNYGDLEGMTFEDLQKHFPKADNIHYAVRKNPSHGETLENFEKRILKTLKALEKKYDGKNILLVGHAGIQHILRKRRMGIAHWKTYFLKNYQVVKNGNLMVFEGSERKLDSELDQWMMSELHTLIKDMTEGLDHYDLMKGLSPLLKCMESLTNWYIRRSRRRFWKSENDRDKEEAYQTLYTVLVEISKLLAPFAPFITEEIFRNLTGLESVHLASFPQAAPRYINEDLNAEISLVQAVVKLGHGARSKANIKVRQPLSKLEVALPPGIAGDQMTKHQDVIREELNVKKIEFLSSFEGKVQMVVRPNARILGPKYGAKVQDIIREAKAGHFQKLPDGKVKVLDYELSPQEMEIGYQGLAAAQGSFQVEADQGIVVILDTTITSELLREGYVRELIRTIQDLRKQADLNVSDRIVVGLSSDGKEIQHAIDAFQDLIKKETLAKELTREKRNTPHEAVIDLGGHGTVVTIEKA